MSERPQDVQRAMDMAHCVGVDGDLRVLMNGFRNAASTLARYAESLEQQFAAAQAERDKLASQVVYEGLIDDVIDAAIQHGYAIALHGSLKRDCDLIAVPWTVEASDPAVLVDAIIKAVGGYVKPLSERGEGETRDPNPKPHGRLAWSIHLGAERYIDLSVMPRNGYEPNLYVTQHALARTEADLERAQAAGGLNNGK